MKRGILFLVGLFLIGCSSSEYTDTLSVDIAWNDEDSSKDWSQELPVRLENRMKGLVREVAMRTTGKRKGKLTFKAKPAVKDSLLKALMTTPGELAFYEVRNFEDLWPVFRALDDDNDESSKISKALKVEFKQKFTMMPSEYSPNLGYVKIEDTAAVLQIFRERSVFSQLRQLRFTSEFYWGKADPNTKMLPLYALNIESDHRPKIYGDVIEEVAFYRSEFGGRLVLTIGFDELAARRWEQMTKRSWEERSAIAIVIDDVVQSAPMASAAIKGGRTEISGDYTLEEVKFLSAILRGGAIPKLTIEEYNRGSK